MIQVISNCDELNGRLRDICRGTAKLPIDKVNCHREIWGLPPLSELPAPDPAVRVTPVASVRSTAPTKRCGGCGSNPAQRTVIVPKTYGPGAELLAIHSEKGYPHCEECRTYAVKMNGWGVDGCRNRIPQIVEDIMPRVVEWVKTDAPLHVRLLGRMVPGERLETEIRSRLTANVIEAIERAHLKRMGHPLPPYPEVRWPKDQDPNAPTVVIMAAGQSTRWHAETPKHLAEINGEPILYRTVRLLRERGIDPIVTTRWEGQWSPLFREFVSTPNDLEIDRVWGNREHIPCIFLYGDCYYTEQAINIILADKHDWWFFGRSKGNESKSHGEMFAIKANDYVLSKCENLRESCRKSGKRCIGLTLYDKCAEKRGEHWSSKSNWTEIDDGTDDVDSLEEFKKLSHRLKPKPKLKPIKATQQDVESRCQVIVTSFMRFDYLDRFVKSVRRKYPNIPILIADYSVKDGERLPPEAEAIRNTPGVDWRQLPFDTCLAVSRNYLVQNATSEFVLLCEDDFTFEDFTRIERMLQLLRSTDAMMVGGLVDYGTNEGGGIRNWVASITQAGKRVEFKPLKTSWREAGGVEYRDTDLVLNFWLARREAVARHQWDERFKIGAEHSDFFIRLKQKRDRVIYTQESIVGHYRMHTGEYRQYRNRAGKYRKMLMRKWKMVRMPRHTNEILRREP